MDAQPAHGTTTNDAQPPAAGPMRACPPPLGCYSRSRAWTSNAATAWCRSAACRLDPINLPDTCPFAPRYNFVQEACLQTTPPLRAVGIEQRAARLFDVHAPWLVRDATSDPQQQTAAQQPATQRIRGVHS